MMELVSVIIRLERMLAETAAERDQARTELGEATRRVTDLEGAIEGYEAERNRA